MHYKLFITGNITSTTSISEFNNKNPVTKGKEQVKKRRKVFKCIKMKWVTGKVPKNVHFKAIKTETKLLMIDEIKSFKA